MRLSTKLGILRKIVCCVQVNQLNDTPRIQRSKPGQFIPGQRIANERCALDMHQIQERLYIVNQLRGAVPGVGLVRLTLPPTRQAEDMEMLGKVNREWLKVPG